mmetsp:Transcript_2364/g.3605  ORF Transcript_2364/g.3605 Transcript_2364/m.3605 type:complete len:876 (+) Transcript_2364:203-2830(+)|eukprot:CAMPEP_0184673676 /NCGR_PEP_ID=MMETSP0308-20130426/86810_1 /TAXON_ID=38269 /ORGANISM="Gloeochaete witrockiana, Strain SAG 46.84" /LENGTH=875 /DNA_ID=CAMNT_0027121189 /DNA_START=164 /DNA_END=2791 /DNA_ORIENTATION=-
MEPNFPSLKGNWCSEDPEAGKSKLSDLQSEASNSDGLIGDVNRRGHDLKGRRSKITVSLNVLLPALVCVIVVISGAVTAYLTTVPLTDGIEQLTFANQRQILENVIADVVGKIFDPLIRVSIDVETTCRTGRCTQANFASLSQYFTAKMDNQVFSPVTGLSITDLSLVSNVANLATEGTASVIISNVLSEDGSVNPCAIAYYTDAPDVQTVYRVRGSDGLLNISIVETRPKGQISGDNPYIQMMQQIVPFKTIIAPLAWDNQTYESLKACQFAPKTMSVVLEAMRLVLNPVTYQPLFVITMTCVVHYNVQEFLDDMSKRLDTAIWLADSSGNMYAASVASNFLKMEIDHTPVDLVVNRVTGKLRNARDSPSDLVMNSWNQYTKALRARNVSLMEPSIWKDVFNAQGQSYHVSAMSVTFTSCPLVLIAFVAQPSEVVYRILHKSVKQTILFDALFMLGAVIFSLFMAFLITRPLTALSERMRDVALLETPLKRRRSSAADFFNRLLHRPSKVYEEERAAEQPSSFVWSSDVTTTTTMGPAAVSTSLRRAINSNTPLLSAVNLPKKSNWAAVHISELSAIYRGFRNVENAMASFRMFVPEDVVRKLVRSGQRAEVMLEHAEVTVMFCDLENFTTLSEDLQLADLALIMQTYFDVVCQSVEATDGVIDKYIGDGVMAMWNASRKVDRHEQRAAECGIVTIQRLLVASEELKRKGLPAIRARFGFHTGNLLVGNIGSRLRLNYTSLGDVVNVASRLESLNKFYGTTILATQEMQTAVSDRFLCRWIDRVRVKGRKSHTDMYEIMCVKQDATPLQVRLCQLSAMGMDFLVSNDLQSAHGCFSEASAIVSNDNALMALLNRVEGFLRDPSTYSSVYRLDVK